MSCAVATRASGSNRPGLRSVQQGTMPRVARSCTHAEARVRHAEWSEDIAPHDIAEAKGAPVQSPHTLRRNRVRHDLRIARLLSGYRNRRCRADGSYDRLKIALLLRRDGRKAGRHPRSVAKKLTERGARLPLHAKLGNHLADRRVESRLAALDALQERNCGQGLRDREHWEDTVMAEQRLVGMIGVSDCLVERDLAADGNDRRGTVITAGQYVGFNRLLQSARHNRNSRLTGPIDWSGLNVSALTVSRPSCSAGGAEPGGHLGEMIFSEAGGRQITVSSSPRLAAKLLRARSAWPSSRLSVPRKRPTKGLASGVSGGGTRPGRRAGCC